MNWRSVMGKRDRPRAEPKHNDALARPSENQSWRAAWIVNTNFCERRHIGFSITRSIFFLTAHVSLMVVDRLPLSLYYLKLDAVNASVFTAVFGMTTPQIHVARGAGYVCGKGKTKRG
jgi:hypothetical protein